jgi:hypothetical protein
LAILGQKALDQFGNTFLVQKKKKILHLFVLKGQRVTQYKRKTTITKIQNNKNNSKVSHQKFKST